MAESYLHPHPTTDDFFEVDIAESYLDLDLDLYPSTDDSSGSDYPFFSSGYEPTSSAKEDEMIFSPDPSLLNPEEKLPESFDLDCMAPATPLETLIDFHTPGSQNGTALHNTLIETMDKLKDSNASQPALTVKAHLQQQRIQSERILKSIPILWQNQSTLTKYLSVENNNSDNFNFYCILRIAMQLIEHWQQDNVEHYAFLSNLLLNLCQILGVDHILKAKENHLKLQALNLPRHLLLFPANLSTLTSTPQQQATTTRNSTGTQGASSKSTLAAATESTMPSNKNLAPPIDCLFA